MKNLLLIITFFLTYIYACPLYAASPGCPERNKESVVTVKTMDAGVQYEYGLSSEEIRQVAGNNSKFTANTRGLTSIELRTRASFSIVTLSNGNIKCAYPATVDIFMGYESPQRVYIDSRYPVGSCQFQVIKNHENEHVRINRETLALIISYVEKGLKDAVMNNGYPIPVPSDEAAKEAIGQNLDATFRSYVAAHVQQRNAMNAMLDTPENYAATSRLCPYW